MESDLRFVTMVGLGAHLDRPAAQRATRAALDTLFERLSGAEARDLAERLSMDMLERLPIPDKHPEPFGYPEFLHRVAGREGVDEASAEGHTVAVLTTLRIAAGEDEFADMVAQLPHDFQPVMAAARRPHVSIHTADDFVSRVAHLTRLDDQGARRACRVVLETLGEYITDREVAELTEELPDAVALPLRQGRADARGATRKLSAQRFLERVARRGTRTDIDSAKARTRAVLATLREAVPDDRFYDVVLQLPDDFADLLTTTPPPD